jgi:peptidyl-dipeptidase Dcp
MKAVLVFFGLMFLFTCTSSGPDPFDTVWNTPFGTPPFDQIRVAHFKPAFEKAMRLENQAVDMIVNNPETSNFKNTIEALEFSGLELARVKNVFYNLTESMSDDKLQAVEKEMAPVLSAHQDDILLNAVLFGRIKRVWEARASLGLNAEQDRLLEETYKKFVRNGANLNESDKANLRKINEEMSLLSVQFGENVLKETNRFELVIEDEADLTPVCPRP